MNTILKAFTAAELHSASIEKVLEESGIPWEHRERAIYKFDVMEKEIKERLAPPKDKDKCESCEGSGQYEDKSDDSRVGGMCGICDGTGKKLVPQPEPPIIKSEKCIIVGNGDSYFATSPRPQDHDCMSDYHSGYVPFVFDCRAEAEDWINKRTQTEWGSAKEYYQIKPAPEGHKSLGYADENYGKNQREKALVAEYVAEIDKLNRDLNAALCRAEQLERCWNESKSRDGETIAKLLSRISKLESKK